MPKRDFASMQTNTPVSQANNAVGRLHHAVSQALSHPTEDLVKQAENSLAHTEQALKQAQGSSNVELAEEMLAVEKSRLDTVHSVDIEE
ncbi:hypothetical protein J2T13_000285 [Paenibacillus sp. DS2015]|uniref:hypothetical protein n=1 Tax=Paenibacillus sp. DS2015 TaxID=3373917 RepID=UPI003D1B874D